MNSFFLFAPRQASRPELNVTFSAFSISELSGKSLYNCLFSICLFFTCPLLSSFQRTQDFSIT